MAAAANQSRTARVQTVIVHVSPHDADRINREIFDAFVGAVVPVIRHYIAHRTSDPKEIAELLNQRGIPCCGQSKWTGTFVRMILTRDKPALCSIKAVR